MYNNLRIINFNSIADHKLGIARRFSRAAIHYDRYAVFQRVCGNKLCTLTGAIIGRRILDAGCGTGWFSRYWKKNGNNNVIAIDISLSMLSFARQKQSAENYILGDIEQLPLLAETIDIVYSNLVVQWCDSLPRAVAELYRVLRPGGIIALSTLAHGSLEELAHAWKQVDNNVHINRFLPQSTIAAAFTPYRHSIQTKPYTLYYKKIADLLREIKGVGANYLHSGRTPGLTSRSKLRALEANWPHKTTRFPLSYHVVYGLIYRD